MITLLKSKIKEIAITRCDIQCEGSITLDEDLIDKMDCKAYEQVHVNSKTGKGRIITYLLPGTRGSKCCEMNGGAANHFYEGEKVHILAFHTLEIYNNARKPIII